MKTQFAFIICLLISMNGFCDKYVWNSKTPYPNFGRHRCAAFAIGNKGYMGTGHVNSGSISQAYSDWWEYDPSSNTWTQKADYPQQRFACAGFVIGNKGYLGGGNEQNFGDRDEFYEFDPINNTWTPKATLPVANGGGLGFSINGVGYMALATSLYSYNVITDTWSPVPCTIPFQDYSSSFVINNQVYVLPQGSNTLYMFDPSTGITAVKAPFIGDARYAACSFAVRGQGYIGLGYSWTSSSMLKDFYQYDPIADSWDTIPKSFPGVRRDYVPSFTIGDNAYFGTGSNGTNLVDVWGYEWKLSVGTEEFQKNTNINLFPNPITTILNIQFNNESQFSESIFKLFQLDGKEVMSYKIPSLTTKVDLSKIDQGIYFAVVLGENHEVLISKKIIKY